MLVLSNVLWYSDVKPLNIPELKNKSCPGLAKMTLTCQAQNSIMVDVQQCCSLVRFYIIFIYLRISQVALLHTHIIPYVQLSYISQMSLSPTELTSTFYYSCPALFFYWTNQHILFLKSTSLLMQIISILCFLCITQV